jgi:hypothetical protein
MTEDLKAQGFPPSFTIGRYSFTRLRSRNGHRWECSDGMRAVGGCRTPWGAFIAQRRWSKVPASPE